MKLKRNINMIKSARFTLPALLAGVMAVSPQALASFDKEELSVGLRLGLYNLDSDRVFPGAPAPTTSHIASGFKNIVPGIQLNVPLTESWSVRTHLDYIKADVKGASGSKSGFGVGLDALYRLDNGVYFGPGVGSTKVGSYTNRNFRGTAGYRRAIKDNLSWSGEYTLQAGGGFTDHAVMFGLIMSFGDDGSALNQIRSSAEEEARREAISSTNRDTTAAVSERDTGKVKTEERTEQPTRSDQEFAPQIRAALVNVDRTTDADGDGVADYRDVCPNTPRGHAVDERGCSVYEQQSQVHHLRVTFGFDSARVPERYYDAIRDLAVLVGVNPELDILIEGHTDLIGTAEYNKSLPERRANAVADILKNQYGIEKARITTVGHGMDKPVVNRITLDANARNRRIETTVTVSSRD